MKLEIKARHPKWIIVSAYIGPKKKLKGLTFPTKYTYYRKKIALTMAQLLNSKYNGLDIWPAKDFEFQVIPYEGADSPKEV